MENYLLYFLKFNLYLVGLMVTHQLFFKKYKNFQFSRPYLLLGTTLALLLPLLSLQSLNKFGDQLLIQNILQEVVVYGNASAPTSSFNWFILFFYSYLLGSAFFFLRFILKIKSLFTLKAQTKKHSSYFSIPNSTSAFSFMNWIFIGELLSPEDREIVLSHEKVHVAKKHSVDLLICQILEIVFWVNPLVFQLKNQFDEVHEYEADELSCKEEESYLHLLLKQNFNQYTFIPIHQFNSTHLKKRIMRIKNQSSQKVNPKSIAFSIAAFGLLFFANQNLNSTEVSSVTNNHYFEESKVISLGEVDKKAQFPGGHEALVKYIIKNTKYPKALIDKKIEGTVYVTFTVNIDGSLSNIKTSRRAHPELQKLALRTIENMPNWEPAIKDGKKVTSEMTLPIKFLPPPPPPPAPPVAPDVAPPAPPIDVEPSKSNN